jgi:hypothetical protein
MVESSPLSLLKLWIEIDFSFFASNLSNCGCTFFDVDEAPSQNWTFASRILVI